MDQISIPLISHPGDENLNYRSLHMAENVFHGYGFESSMCTRNHSFRDKSDISIPSLDTKWYHSTWHVVNLSVSDTTTVRAMLAPRTKTIQLPATALTVRPSLASVTDVKPALTTVVRSIAPSTVNGKHLSLHYVQNWIRWLVARLRLRWLAGFSNSCKIVGNGA